MWAIPILLSITLVTELTEFEETAKLFVIPALIISIIVIAKNEKNNKPRF